MSGVAGAARLLDRGRARRGDPDEAEERALRARLINWLGEQYGSLAREMLTDEVEREDKDQEIDEFKLELPVDDFGTLLIQFRALGLIENSERKRSVSDKGTYWTLTAYGDAHLTTLRAIHRQVRSPDAAPAKGVKAMATAPATSTKPRRRTGSRRREPSPER